MPLSRSAAAALLAGMLAVGGCGGEESAPDGSGDRAAPQPAPERIPPAVRGGERIVVFGDSLAVTGPGPWPERLAAELARRGAPGAEVVNIAEPGSVSADWAPGGASFEAALAPEIGRTDVFIVTVGGNDLERALAAGSGPEAAAAGIGGGAAAAVESAIDGARRNLRRSLGAIRQGAPAATIAWVGYPDYSEAAAFRERSGLLASIGIGVAIANLADAAKAAGAGIVVDTTAATSRRGVDSLLDGEYLNEAGHGLFARRIARALTQPGEAAAAARP